MLREQVIAERTEQGRKFEERYRDFLTTLKEMPRRTQEEKAGRWEWFRRYPLHDEFILDLMDTYQPKAFKRFCSRVNDPSIDNSEDLDIASFKHMKEMDPAVFMEVVQRAVCIYTGIKQDGGSYNFVSCVGRLYSQEAMRQASKAAMEENGGSDGEISRKNLPNIMRLKKRVEELFQKDPSISSREEALKQVLSEGTHGCTRKDLELVRVLIRGKGRSIYDQVTEEGTVLGDILADSRDYYSEIFEKSEEDIPFLKIICESILQEGEPIRSTGRKKEQEFFRIFFTRDILKGLKLDETGKPYPQEPAGNEEFYQKVKSQGDIMYQKIFYMGYLHRAFAEKPENFYEVYVRVLREDFNFSDKLVAEMMGKDKSVVSRRRKDYLDKMKDFYDYYRNI